MRVQLSTLVGFDQHSILRWISFHPSYLSNPSCRPALAHVAIIQAGSFVGTIALVLLVCEPVGLPAQILALVIILDEVIL